MATLQNIGKLKYRGKDGQWHPLPVVVQDADGSVSTISGKGAPTSATQGKVNQLYRDEDTQKLYICTATDGGYTWEAVVSDTEDAVTYTAQTLTEEQKTQARANIGAGTSNFSGSYNDLSNKPNIPAATVIDTTLTKSGQAADAKAAGDAIEKKIDAPQVAQVGEVLTVEAVDTDGKPTKWKTAPAPAEQKQADWNQNDETAADYVKNRPFYTDIIEKTFESSADNHYIEFNGVPFKAGDSVDITVDGERFTLIAQVDTDPEYPEVIIGAYIGDSYDDIKSGSGQYGWQYYYTEEGNVSGIISFENHIFIYKTVEDHKLDMKYSPVQISESVTTNNINHIDSLLIFNDIKTKGLTVSWDEEFNSYVLMSIDNLSPCTTTFMGRAGYEASSTLNVEHSFPFKSTGLQNIINNNLHVFEHHRLIFDSVVLNGRGYRIALTSSTDNQYTGIDLKNTIYLTGSFVTAEGYLYLVILEIVVSEDKTIQNSSKLKIKRIL